MSRKKFKFKEKIERLISPFKNRIFLVNNLISLSLLLTSLLVLFPSFGLKSSTQIEDSAFYYSDIVLNKTVNKTYLSLIAEAKDSSIAIPDTEYEFYNLYGSFRESKSVFAATANADKSHSVIFDEVDNSNLNYSFLFVERAGFSNVRYKEAWKHEFYPLQLEFKGNHDVGKEYFSFVYISESDADLLLTKSKYKDCHNHEDLLGKGVTLTIDGIKNEWMIADIFLETNYFYDSLTDVMGHFFLAYNKFPEGINKQSLFFLREFGYQNQYYLKYAKLNYSRDFYNFKIGTYNLNEDCTLNVQKLEQIFYEKSEAFFYFLLTLQIALFFISLYWIYRTKIYRYPISLILIAAIFCFPYFIYKIVFKISRSVFIFSSSATQINLLLIVVMIVFLTTLILVDLFKKGQIKDAKGN